MSLLRRLKYLWPSYRRRQERDLQEELHSLQSMAEPKELGNLTLAAEDARKVWGWNWLDATWQDVRYGCRTLLRNRRVTAIALVSLALGIGANTVVFSLIHTLVLRPLPYPESDRLVRVWFRPLNGGREAGLTRGECATSLGGNTEVFEHFGCFTDPVTASIADPGGANNFPERVTGWQFTAGAVRALGIHPLFGRWFTETDEVAGAGRVLLISSDLWKRRFVESPEVLGKQIRFNGEIATIIGVLPESFEVFDRTGDYVTPFRGYEFGAQTSARILGGVARLNPDVGLAGAQSKMDALATGLAEQFPQTNKNWGIVLSPIVRLEDARDPLIILQGTVALVLLIACANAAGLLLAQGTTQHREMAVRAALGSSRARLFRQLLIHAVMLSLAGGVLGLLVGLAGGRVLTSALPAGLGLAVYQSRLDPAVLLFTFGACLISALAVGIAPAVQISHAHPLDAMHDSGRSATAGHSRRRLRSIFVTMQLALALTLLVGAGLMLNSLIRMANAPLGFDPENLLTTNVQLSESKFRRPTSATLASGALEMAIDPQVPLTTEQMRQNLAGTAGVTAATGIAIFPPFSGSLNLPVQVDGVSTAESQRSQFLPVLADYFKTLQVRVIYGREFTPADTAAARPIAVVNQAMAKRYWPNDSPLGKHVRVESPMLPNEPIREVVGVVDEVMQYAGQQDRNQLYLPYLQLSAQHDERLTNQLRELTFIVRTTRPAGEIEAALQSAVSLADNSQAVSSVRTMRQTAYNMARRRVYTGLLGTFGAVAVLLAAIGVYGVMAQVVSQRTSEIGIRMALGADSRRVRHLVIRQGGVIIGLGLALGTVGSLALTRTLQSQLFGLTSTDPLTIAACVLLLGVIGLLACYIPARRASRIDPMVALRHE